MPENKVFGQAGGKQLEPVYANHIIMDYLIHDAIEAGVFPITVRRGSRIKQRIFYMVHYIPWTVNVVALSIIPVFNLICLVCKLYI